MATRDAGTTAWPALPLAQWADTRSTLHRYVQIVGKIRMALVPSLNHWWHVTLHVDARGLTTGAMPTGDGRSVEIAFDFVAHRLVVTLSDGGGGAFELADGLACADFHAQLFGLLEGHDVDARIRPAPYDLGGPLLSEDRVHASYDADAVTRYWDVLRRVNDVLGEFAGAFNGKQSPVQLFWHSFDLALARFSGRPAPRRRDADRVTAEAYSHEVIAFGFWPGDERFPRPAFYSYTAPAPGGLTDRRLRPDAAWWDAGSGTAYLRYEEMRTAADPRAALLGFLDSAYEAGARSADWDLAALATRRDRRRR